MSNKRYLLVYLAQTLGEIKNETLQINQKPLVPSQYYRFEGFKEGSQFGSRDAERH